MSTTGLITNIFVIDKSDNCENYERSTDLFMLPWNGLKRVNYNPETKEITNDYEYSLEVINGENVVTCSNK